MAMLLLFVGQAPDVGIPAQPNEMDDAQYARWTRPPSPGDVVQFMDQSSGVRCLGAIAAVEGPRVKVTHCDCDEWLPWDELQIERDTETGCWMIKTPFHASV